MHGTLASLGAQKAFQEDAAARGQQNTITEIIERYSDGGWSDPITEHRDLLTLIGFMKDAEIAFDPAHDHMACATCIGPRMRIVAASGAAGQR
jgi:hypothetical protein